MNNNEVDGKGAMEEGVVDTKEVEVKIVNYAVDVFHIFFQSLPCL